MALREFVDDQHREWRVWAVTPEQMRPVHAREMFHGRYVDYQEGWLVFESATERRRLAPFPARWTELPVEELEMLLRRAQVVPTRLSEERQSGVFPRFVEEEDRVQTLEAVAPALRSTLVLRRFLDAGSRTWTAALVERGPGSAGPVLRFSANDGATVDVESFPDDWARLPRERLCELLERSLARGGPAANAPPQASREERRS